MLVVPPASLGEALRTGRALKISQLADGGMPPAYDSMNQDVTAISIERFSPADFSRFRATLTEILRDAVDGGASVSFIAPLSDETVKLYWEGVETGLIAGDLILLGGFWKKELKGTVNSTWLSHRITFRLVLFQDTPSMGSENASFQRQSSTSSWGRGNSR